MFKHVLTLLRGAAHDASEEFADSNALKILSQQLRDCAVAVEQARQAVAVATAQNRQEAEQCERLVKRIADLEQRTVSALEQGRDDLAREAAETVAMLEAERDASEEAQRQFSGDIARLRGDVRKAEMKLRELKRGQRIANATESAQKLRVVAPAAGLSSLKDAEKTLDRLRNRQRQIDLTGEALARMDATGDPAAITEKLAAAGCGAPLMTTADDVLARLAGQVKKKAG